MTPGRVSAECPHYSPLLGKDEDDVLALQTRAKHLRQLLDRAVTLAPQPATLVDNHLHLRGERLRVLWYCPANLHAVRVRPGNQPCPLLLVGEEAAVDLGVVEIDSLA